MYFLRAIITFVLYIVFICAITKSEFSFPRSSSHRINIFSKPVSNLKRSDEYRIPEGKTIRKLNQLKRQLLLMCLTGGSRKIRAVDTEGRFFFPTVIQQTGVNVGGSGSHEDQVDSGDGGEGFSNNCDSLTTSGLLGHPHLGTFSALLGNLPNNEDSKLYGMNIKRYVIKPLYRSMKNFYKLF